VGSGRRHKQSRRLIPRSVFLEAVEPAPGGLNHEITDEQRDDRAENGSQDEDDDLLGTILDSPGRQFQTQRPFRYPDGAGIELTVSTCMSLPRVSEADDPAPPSTTGSCRKHESKLRFELGSLSVK